MHAQCISLERFRFRLSAEAVASKFDKFQYCKGPPSQLARGIPCNLDETFVSNDTSGVQNKMLAAGAIVDTHN